MAPKKGDTHAPPIERLARRSEQTGECWVWMGVRDKDGYGYLQLRRGTPVRVHRYAYEFFVGPIPDGLVIDHLCGTKACWNPDHLDPVPSAVNTRRFIATITHCVNGHSLSGANLRVNTRNGGVRRRCRACARECARRARAAKRNELCSVLGLPTAGAA